MVLAMIPSIRNILQAEKPAYGNGMLRFLKRGGVAGALMMRCTK